MPTKIKENIIFLLMIISIIIMTMTALVLVGEFNFRMDDMKKQFEEKMLILKREMLQADNRMDNSIGLLKDEFKNHRHKFIGGRVIVK